MSIILNFNNWSKLNEDEKKLIDLSKDPGLPKTFASLKAQAVKGVKFPMATMGKYLFMINTPYDYVGNPPTLVNGVILSFQASPFPGVGNLPCIPDYLRNFGGTFSWAYMSNNMPTENNANYDPALGYGQGSPESVAKIVSDIMSKIPIDTLKAIYNANPNKAKYDAAIASFKASPTGKLTIAGLTGTAKAFYGA
jgi:hypothetical protein